MKTLICELCEGTDFIKENSVYVCRTCGAKFTVEEARKMLQGSSDTQGSEVTASRPKPVSTETPDNLINNYLVLANNAISVGNYIEADTYASKILELKSDHPQAWLLKGTSVGWMSDMQTNRLGEAINCFNNAVCFAGEDQSENIKQQAVLNLAGMSSRYVDAACNCFREQPDVFVNVLKSIAEYVNNDVTGFIKSLSIDSDELPVTVFESLTDTAIRTYLGTSSFDVPDEYYKSLIGACANILRYAVFDMGTPRDDDSMIGACSTLIDINEELLEPHYDLMSAPREFLNQGFIQASSQFVQFHENEIKACNQIMDKIQESQMVSEENTESIVNDEQVTDDAQIPKDEAGISEIQGNGESARKTIYIIVASVLIVLLLLAGFMFFRSSSKTPSARIEQIEKLISKESYSAARELCAELSENIQAMSSGDLISFLEQCSHLYELTGYGDVGQSRDMIFQKLYEHEKDYLLNNYTSDYAQMALSDGIQAYRWADFEKAETICEELHPYTDYLTLESNCQMASLMAALGRLEADEGLLYDAARIRRNTLNANADEARDHYANCDSQLNISIDHILPAYGRSTFAVSPNSFIAWYITDVSGPTNLRATPRGEVCMSLDAYNDFRIITDGEKNGWLSVDCIFNETKGHFVDLTGSYTGDYWIFKNVLSQY